MRVLVCGGRNYFNDQFIEFVLSRMKIDILIHGDARGADTLAKEYAEYYGIPHIPFPAKWEKYGKRRAGPIRNTQMIIEGLPDIVVAFPGGSGTRDMIRQATFHNIAVMPL